jgi:biopolymer transport protein ExbB/TolQ
MVEGELAAAVAQFGAAGIVGWMWLSERRAAAVREKQLAEAHERLINERQNLDVVLRALENSTRTLTALEVGQRQVVELLTRLTSVSRRRRDEPSEAERVG